VTPCAERPAAVGALEYKLLSGWVLRDKPRA
jgi:hypothetical protein